MGGSEGVRASNGGSIKAGSIDCGEAGAADGEAGAVGGAECGGDGRAKMAGELV